MGKWLRMIPLHFKSGIQGITRHSASAISAVSAVGVTLILMSVFILLTANINNFTYHIEDNFAIRVSIDSVLDADEIEILQQKIYQIPGVSTVEFSSKDSELRQLKNENEQIFGMYQEGDANPMRDTFKIETSTPDKIKEITQEISKLEGIEKAEYGGDGISMMISFFQIVRNGGFLFVGVLSILAVFLISNTIKMTIYARKVEISIMRNVGAGNWFIRIPFVIEGLFIGLFGTFIPVLLTYFGYAFLYHKMNGQFLSSMFVMKSVHPFVSEVCIVLMVCGALVGMLGSFLAVSKYLRWKR